MSKIGFIFAGQGQQFLHMGQDFYEGFVSARDLYDRAEEILGYDLLGISEAQLQTTEYTQPALYVLNAVIAKLLEGEGIFPFAASGLSLGEYNALLVSEVFDFETGLKIIKERAKIMQYEFEPFSTGMVACIKTNRETIELLIQDSDIEICNVNTPSQIVIGGETSKLSELLKTLKENKVRAIPLKVSTVSHMSLMNDASDKLRKILELYEYQKPILQFINNIHGKLQTTDFENSLSKHISNPTEFSSGIKLMQEMGVDTFIEIGPKGSISKFVKEICGDVKTYNVYDVTTFEVLKHG